VAAINPHDRHLPLLSAADGVIVTVANQPSRMVERVSYITCPGDRVSIIVTDLPVFESTGEFELTAFLPRSRLARKSEPSADELYRLRNVRRRAAWSGLERVLYEALWQIIIIQLRPRPLALRRWPAACAS
jgi:hypothetical protein